MRYKAKELKKLPTLDTNQTSNLKLIDDGKRIWLSHRTIKDGMPYDNQVTIEILLDNQWTPIEVYEG